MNGLCLKANYLQLIKLFLKMSWKNKQEYRKKMNSTLEFTTHEHSNQHWQSLGTESTWSGQPGASPEMPSSSLSFFTALPGITQVQRRTTFLFDLGKQGI
jgi:hypothetical protein